MFGRVMVVVRGKGQKRHEGLLWQRACAPRGVCVHMRSKVVGQGRASSAGGSTQQGLQARAGRHPRCSTGH